MIILMQSLNEEKMVDPVISDFHDLDWVSRVIVIDGGSQDFTVHKLNQWPKCEVYQHFYDRGYHAAQSMQRNISLTYIPTGEVCFILDFDEKMSDELKDFLESVDKDGMPMDADVVCVSRISHESMRHDDSPFALLDEQGFPVPSHTIGEYPDWQARLIRRDPKMFFINSPHHVLIGPEKQITRERTDIIHYHGKADARDRENIEILWATTQARRKTLGLEPDVFEARLAPEFAMYGA